MAVYKIMWLCLWCNNNVERKFQGGYDKKKFPQAQISYMQLKCTRCGNVSRHDEIIDIKVE